MHWAHHIKFVWVWLFAIPTFLSAQELNCRVDLLLAGVQTTSTTAKLQRDIAAYMNNKQWTNDRFENAEKISCSITITLNSFDPARNSYSGICIVQALRPVFGSKYETVTLNFTDENFNILYDQNSTLISNEIQYTSELVALLDFLGYLIIGFDYDSFSLSGGTPYFQKALNVINVANSATNGAKGWTTTDVTTPKSRYAVVENVLNSSYAKIRMVTYEYHRLCLDKMSENPTEARKALTKSLTDLQQLFTQNPGLPIMRIFLSTKNKEIYQIYKSKEATRDQKSKFVSVMNQIFASSTLNYEDVMDNLGDK